MLEQINLEIKSCDYIQNGSRAKTSNKVSQTISVLQ